jgi:hypothetical protein
MNSDENLKTELTQSFNELFAIFYSTNYYYPKITNSATTVKTVLTLNRLFNEEAVNEEADSLNGSENIRQLKLKMLSFCQDIDSCDQWYFDFSSTDQQNAASILIEHLHKMKKLMNKNAFLKKYISGKEAIFDKTIALLTEAYALNQKDGGRKKRRLSTQRRRQRPSTQRRRRRRSKSSYSFSPPSSSKLSQLHNLFL